MARLDWTQLPPALRARVEEFAGSPVARAQSQDGGFSAGLASRLTFADGRRLFVKAVQESSEGTFALYVREAEVLGALPRPGSTTEDHIALLSAAGGAWFEKCCLPAPDGMTTLRDFQRREAVIATDWIAELVR